jgi:hypothetical protein
VSLAGVRILWDRSHGQESTSYWGWSTMVSDLTRRGAEVAESFEPVTPAHLADFDVLWTVDVRTARWTQPEADAVAAWLRTGGGLLLEGDGTDTISDYNLLLSTAGAGLEYSQGATSGVTRNVFPHPATDWVTSVIVGGGYWGGHLSRVDPPAGHLVNDAANVPVIAWSEVAAGAGRIVATNSEIFSDGWVDYEDNRRFGNQVFNWLTGLEWVAVDPVSGTVPAGTSTEVTVTFDATDRFEGEYRADLVVASNDPVTPEVIVPATLHVTGAPDIEVDPLAIDFGLVFIGANPTSPVTVSNLGTDLLTVSSVTVDHPDYSVDVTAFPLDPGEDQEIQVTFAPSSPGVIDALLTITSDDPDEPTVVISLTGEGVEPPVITISPDVLVEDLSTGETSTQTLTIANDGVSDLEWQIGMEFVTTADKSQYVLTPPSPNPGGTGSDGEPLPPGRGTAIEATLGDLTDVRVLWDRSHGQSDATNWSTLISDLTLRGAEVVESIWLQEDRALVIEGDNTAAIRDFNLLLSRAGAGIEYSQVDGTGGPTTNIFPHETTDGVSVIRLQNAALAHLSTVESPARHLVNDVAHVPAIAFSEPGAGRIIAMSDEIFSDFVIGQEDNQLFGNQVFDWLADAPSWLSVDPDAGSIPAGTATDVMATFDATDLEDGDYLANLVVMSSDPVTPEVIVPVILHVTGAGYVMPVDSAVGTDLGLPTVHALHASAPNPFRGRSTIRFDLPRQSAVDLRVFDVSGRLVRVLVNESLPRGPHAARWDGFDQSGSRAAPGVYFYRMVADEFSSVRKLVVVR